MTPFLISKIIMKITLFLSFFVMTSVFGLSYKSFKMKHVDEHQDHRLNHQRKFIENAKINTQKKQKAKTRKFSALMKNALFLKVTYISLSNYFIFIVS